MRKRKLICTASLLVSSIPFTVHGETDTNVQVNNTVEEKGTVENLHVQSGKIELDLYFDAPIVQKDSVTISIAGSQGTKTFQLIETEGVTIEEMNKKRQPVSEGEETYFYHVTVENLPVGTYTIELAALGYETFTHTVDLITSSKRLVIGSTSTTIGDEQIPGAFLAGDVDKDGKITENDYEKVIENIGKAEEGSLYDLNKDGNVDIADLVIVNNNIGKTQEEAIVTDTDPIIDPDNVTYTAEGALEGDVKDLFIQNDNKIQLSTQSDSEEEAPVISEENPVSLSLNVGGMEKSDVKMEKVVLTAPSDTAPTSGTVLIDGKAYPFTSQQTRMVRSEDEEKIVIDLGQQVAVKEITIQITGSKSNTNLVEIAQVEFINSVYKEIPPPKMDIPNITSITSSIDVYGGILDVNWEKQANVSGYELMLQEVDSSGKVKSTKTYKTKESSIRLEKLNAYATYRLTMQSVNGEWKSGIKEATEEDLDGKPENVNDQYEPIPWAPDSIVEFKIIPGTVPDRPESLSVGGEVGGLSISWAANKKALEQKIEYRILGTTEWTGATEEWLTGTSYRLEGLKQDETYEIRMKAKNHLGESKYSQIYLGTTKSVTMPIIPKYGALFQMEEGKKPEGIVSVENNQAAFVTNEYAVVDYDPASYYQVNSWDGSIYSKRGPIITFEEAQTINVISLVRRLDVSSPDPYTANIGYTDEETGKWTYLDVPVRNQNGYTLLKLPKQIKTDKIQVNVSVYPSVLSGKVTISELAFYNYGTLESDVKDLFKDDLQIELNEDVTLETIESLELQANTMDPKNLEYHPNRAVLLKEIQRAKDIYNDGLLKDDIIEIDPSIQSGNSALNISNKWQSLGYAAKSGDTITVYVGTSNEKRQLELAVRQPFGESDKYVSQTFKLQPGKNEIQIPKIHSLDAENGGTLYVRTTWDNDKDTTQFKIRVSGATKVPMLNVNNIIGDEEAMKNEIRTYIRELKTFVTNLPKMYPTEEDKVNNIYTYNEQTSILNNTDIEGDRFTLTVPATQVLKGIVDGLASEEQQVERLYNTVMAWEQFIQMTYAKKGVYETPIDFNGNGTIDADEQTEFSKNRAPRTRINIKYQRMFSGAAGYATADHIGIQFGLVPSLMKGVPYELDSEGNVLNPDEGRFFGWLIAHEMGHVVDIAKRTYSETSNNILSLMDQTFDGQDQSRLETSGVYEKIYDKVTSGSTGMSSNVFVSLGMFWQLQLAYEQGTTSSMLVKNTDTNPDNDSYYAKMNRLYRTLPTEMQNLDKDQLLIRVASDAAKKDLRGFFKAWGLESDQNTDMYLTQKGYEKETRPIQYLNDEAKRQQLAGKGEMDASTAVVASFANGIDDGARVNGNELQLNLDVNKGDDNILGYEIYVNGEVAGFVERTGDKTVYTHSFHSMNNRVFSFDVKAYDYHLNETQSVHLGTVKVAHDGTISKSNWTTSSNETVAEHANTDSQGKTLEGIHDGNKDTFETITKTSGDPYVIIDLGRNTPIVGMTYTAPVVENKNIFTKLFRETKVSSSALTKYEIQVSEDGKTWTSVKTGTMKTSVDNPSETIYFEKPGTTGGNQYWMQNVQYVKVIGKGASRFDVAEIDLLSPTGDNVEIGVDENDHVYKNGIGVLKSDFTYAEGRSIPAGSIVITGEYRGNPAYNIPLVLDENGENVAYNAKAIVLAEIPEGAAPTEVAEGNWIYWIEPDHLDEFTATQIKANLYRVNDANTLAGQRLVSDSFYTRVPETLPEIELNRSKTMTLVEDVYTFTNKQFNKLEETEKGAN